MTSPRKRYDGRQFIRYIPIDEWEAKPLTRILRALLHRSWVDVDALYEAFDTEDDAESNRFAAAFGFGVRRGYLERRGERPFHEYRLTEAGRLEIERRLHPDRSDRYAPARPGTEHLLCE
jgi:hypothetical protein